MSHKTNYVECRQTLVAASDVGHVTTCPECGHVHLNLRAVTVRFELDAFRELTEMLSFAQKRLDVDPALHDSESSESRVLGTDGGNNIRH